MYWTQTRDTDRQRQAETECDRYKQIETDRDLIEADKGRQRQINIIRIWAFHKNRFVRV